MSKREEFNSVMKDSMRNKDKNALATVRLIMAALKDRDIAARAKGNNDGISEDEILAMLQSMIKQRRDSIKMYEDGGRPELAAQEQSEIEIIEGFLPAQMSDEEVSSTVDALITELGASALKDMGRVMGELKTRYAGQIDMGKAGGLVKGKLG